MLRIKLKQLQGTLLVEFCYPLWTEVVQAPPSTVLTVFLIWFERVLALDAIDRLKHVH